MSNAKLNTLGRKRHHEMKIEQQQSEKFCVIIMIKYTTRLWGTEEFY